MISPNINIRIKRRYVESTAAVLAAGLLIVPLNHFLNRSDTTLPPGQTAIGHSNEAASETIDLPGSENHAVDRHQQSSEARITAHTMVQHLPFTLLDIHKDLLLQGDTQQVTTDLMHTAAEAVRLERDDILGRTIAQLGSVALLNKDMESARVYLEEALQIFDIADDELGLAGVELLRGQLNIEKRWQAREAAYAYDDMQLAAWKIAHERFDEAVPELQSGIATNLELERFGAAAAGYEMLYKGYLKNDRLSEAVNAGSEAVRLHAASGRSIKAHKLLENLQSIGMDEGVGQTLLSELSTRLEEYENGIRQMGQATDYEQLYNHYLHEGDPVRAWQFRIKSRESLKNVSRLAMHRRQTGVIAMLYNSNDDMKRAQNSLDQARQVFSRHEAEDLFELSQSLEQEIW